MTSENTAPSAAVGLARILLRAALYPPVALASFGAFAFSRRDLRSRVEWLRRTSLRHLRWSGIRVRTHGTVPRGGLIVSNHVSFLDILGLSIATGCAFVSKKEIADWPLFGWFAKMGATIFLDRERRSAVGDVAEKMRAYLDAGIPLVLFPEGTSTDGTGLLPFRTSLFEPAVTLGCPLTACGLRYSITDGTVRDDVAYWGDMTLGTLMGRMLRKNGISLDIHFGPTRIPSGDRKTIARDYAAEVRTLAGLPEK